MKSLTKTQYDMLAIIRSVFCGNEFNISSDVDWLDLFEESKKQTIVPLIFEGLFSNKSMPKEVLRLFKQESLSVIINNEKVIKVQKMITKIFDKNNIKYAILKGTSVSRLYPKPNLRVLGDIDILIKPTDNIRVYKILEENDIKLVCENPNHFHSNFEFDNVSIELHQQVNHYGETESELNLKEFMQSAVDNTELNEFKYLCFDFQAISLLMHMRQHMIESGLGIRQFIDWTIFVDRYSNNFNNNFMLTLKKFNLYNFAIYLIKTAELFLGFKSHKIEISEDIKEKYCNLLMKEFFCCGNLGKSDYEAGKSKQIIKQGKDKKNKLTGLSFIEFCFSRSNETWPISNKIKILKVISPIYLPLRYICRMIIGKREKIKMLRFYRNTLKRKKMYKQIKI